MTIKSIKALSRRLSFPILFTLTLWTNLAHAKPDPGLSATLSLVPGLGQLANGNFEETPIWLLATFGLAGATRTAAGRYMAFQVWLYNMYDAYRDAEPQNGMTHRDSSVADFLSMLNPANIINPIGTPMVGVAALAGINQYHGYNLTGRQLLTRMFVGFGEEGFFRGFLFPGFTDLFSSEFAGAMTSSALFAIAHLQYGPAQQAIVFVLGNLFCLNYHLVDYHLTKNIFAHGWWDFFLSPADDKNTGQDRPLVKGLNVGLRFNFSI